MYKCGRHKIEYIQEFNISIYWYVYIYIYIDMCAIKNPFVDEMMRLKNTYEFG